MKQQEEVADSGHGRWISRRLEQMETTQQWQYAAFATVNAGKHEPPEVAAVW
jgi:hypothetical protein